MSDKKPSTRAIRLREGSQQRRDQEKQEVRKAILDAASELFQKHGYHEFSLRQVAETIGYSPGTIYLYFKDKDEVLFTIMQEGLAIFSAMLTESAASTTDPRTALSQIGRAYVKFGLGYPTHYQLMFMQRTDYLIRPNGGTDPEALGAIFRRWFEVIEAAMKAGVLQLGDPVSVGDALWALLHGVISIAILMPNFDEKRINGMIEAALTLLTTGVHKT